MRGFACLQRRRLGFLLVFPSGSKYLRIRFPAAQRLRGRRSPLRFYALRIVCDYGKPDVSTDWESDEGCSEAYDMGCNSGTCLQLATNPRKQSLLIKHPETLLKGKA